MSQTRQVTIIGPQVLPSQVFDTGFAATINPLYSGNYQAGIPVVATNGDVYVYRMNTSTAQAGVYKFDSSGIQDTTYTSNQGSPAVNYTLNTSLCLTSSGKIVGGNYSGQTAHGVTTYGLYRLNTNGTRDNTFVTGTGLTNAGQPQMIIEVESTNLLVGCTGVVSYNGVSTASNILKLNSNGGLDTSFNTAMGTGFDGDVTALCLQSDGSYVIGGSFGSFNGNTRNALVRVSSSGVEDTTFASNLGTGFAGGVYGITQQADGKLIVTGSFGQLNGNTRYGVVRLNTDGTEDSSFYSTLAPSNFATFFNSVQIGTDVVLSGSFSTINGTSNRLCCRVNSSGVAYSTFTSLVAGLIPSVGFSVAYGYGMTYDSNNNYFYIGANINGTYNGSVPVTAFLKMNSINPTLQNFTVPAGVSSIIVQPVYNTGEAFGSSKALSVTPNTTYTVTINSASVVANNANTLGSIYSWTGSGYLRISWVE